MHTEQKQPQELQTSGFLPSCDLIAAHELVHGRAASESVAHIHHLRHTECHAWLLRRNAQDIECIAERISIFQVISTMHCLYRLELLFGDSSQLCAERSSRPTHPPNY